MEKLESVFWDLDGTIADTEMSGHRKAFNLAFSDFLLDWYWSKEDYLKLLLIAGGSNRIKYYSFKTSTNISDEVIKKLHICKQFHYSKLLAEGKINLRIGVKRLIKELSCMNVKQWIVTTSGNKAVESLLNKYFNSPEYRFNGIIAGDDVQNHKPNPEAYKLALDRSHSSINTSLAIEDSKIGLEAAKAAKIKCLITLSPWLNNVPKSMLKADLILDSLGDHQQSSRILYGHTKEDMVNYECLLSILNG